MEKADRLAAITAAAAQTSQLNSGTKSNGSTGSRIPDSGTGQRHALRLVQARDTNAEKLPMKRGDDAGPARPYSAIMEARVLIVSWSARADVER